MEMPTILTIICASIIVVSFGIVLVARYITYKKDKINKGEKIDIYEFISENSNSFINRISAAVSMLNTKPMDYTSKEEYEEAIVSLTIANLKEDNGMIFSKNIFDFISEENLRDVIVAILNDHKVDIFSILSIFDINKHQKLYDSEVIDKIAKMDVERSEEE